MNMIKYGRMVRHAREDKGLTQAQVAAELGVSQTYVSNIELGKKTAQASEAMKLEDLLGVPVGVYVAHYTGSGDDIEEAIVKSGLSVEEQDLVLGVYGFVAKRKSVENAKLLRLQWRQKNDPPSEEQS